MVPRAVLDTNVYISAFGWRGAEEKLVQKGLKGEVTLIHCQQLLEEFVTVASRPRFGFDPQELMDFVRTLMQQGRVVEPTVPVERVCRDPDDEFILSLAATARVDYIVTGDGGLLEMEVFRSIPIIRAPAMLELIP